MQWTTRATILAGWVWGMGWQFAGAFTPVADEPFAQEISRRLPWPADRLEDQKRVRWVEVGPDGWVRMLAGGRWYAVEGDRVTAPATGAASGSEGFSFPDREGRGGGVPVRAADVIQVARGPLADWVATASEVYRVRGGEVTAQAWPGAAGAIRQVAPTSEGEVWVASGGGLFRRGERGWERVVVDDGKGRSWAVSDVRGVAHDREGAVWVATPAGVATQAQRGEAWRFFEGRDGLPYADFNRVTAGPDGSIWLATKLGVIRWDGREWSYRQGPRWLPGDGVHGVAVDATGTAWLATDGGLGVIERRLMTLAQKAAWYEVEMERYLMRTEFGYTSEVRLEVPGDRSKIIQQDSDNDGLWTAMYGAGQCFGYAATGQEALRVRARRVFEALRFLQVVTQGGSNAPPKGFVARTIRPVEWPDPNVGRVESDRRIRAERDRLWKVYEPRWPRSADGKWFWKSDTSSDELDGHYFFYGRYYDLVADAAEQERVREVVRDLTDHLMVNGYGLRDHDGEWTRWGVFGPESLNRDPNWWVERGLNSLSLLSYLAVAEHVTGDGKYGLAARELIDRHGYGANAMNPKTQTGPGSGNQSDDEMAFMCFYNLLKYSRDAIWRDHWTYAFFVAAMMELPEMNPFFNFTYAGVGIGRKVTNPWGTFSLTPWEGWLEDSVATLRGFPLDRVDWPHRNSHRLDLVRLPPQQSPDIYEPEKSRRGYRVNGKVLPVAERHFGHWNTDPWRLDYGGDGRELAGGTVFLLPYYMGLYHGFLEVPQAP